MRGRHPDLSTRCWCNQPGGCRVPLTTGPAGRICDACRDAGHRALRVATVNRLRRANGLPEVAHA